ncbi:hypothetical protein MUK42_31864 [Musa troglodytarum]|uniref:Uncharacterized protein n=1 Tax=Musa troglodytarum TaxID=320322 RepID=A0A9E7K7F3_9LILI|nr:hypothetical protein MUK42_31864 [Musa troglodytarum]
MRRTAATSAPGRLPTLLQPKTYAAKDSFPSSSVTLPVVPSPAPEDFSPVLSSPLPSGCLTADNLRSCTRRTLSLSAASLFCLSSPRMTLPTDAQVLQALHHLPCHGRIERNFWSAASGDVDQINTFLLGERRLSSFTATLRRSLTAVLTCSVVKQDLIYFDRSVAPLVLHS